MATPSPCDHGDTRPAPRPALYLGWSGVTPFAVLSIGAIGLRDPGAATALAALVTYGAVILSFMGAVHWGVASTHGFAGSPRLRAWLFSVSVMPALLAWGATLIPQRAGLVVLAVAFLALLAFDLWAVRHRLLPAWYGPLRVQLTSAVVVCLAAALT